MFTGIVDHCGHIQIIEQIDSGIRLIIESQFTDFKLGESIAVDGICLTVIDATESTFTCELSPETLNITTAKDLSVGSHVNLERAMSASDRFGGHFVTGHVDTTAKLIAKEAHAEFLNFRFGGLPATAQGLLVAKGSVTVNGASLTINEVFDDGFAVMLIPHTLAITNLANLESGSSINLEYDCLARIVAKQISLMNA